MLKNKNIGCRERTKNYEHGGIQYNHVTTSIQQKYYDTEEDNNIDLLQNIIYGYQLLGCFKRIRQLKELYLVVSHTGLFTNHVVNHCRSFFLIQQQSFSSYNVKLNYEPRQVMFSGNLGRFRVDVSCSWKPVWVCRPTGNLRPRSCRIRQDPGLRFSY